MAADRQDQNHAGVRWKHRLVQFQPRHLVNFIHPIPRHAGHKQRAQQRPLSPPKKKKKRKIVYILNLRRATVFLLHRVLPFLTGGSCGESQVHSKLRHPFASPPAAAGSSTSAASLVAAPAACSARTSSRRVPQRFKAARRRLIFFLKKKQCGRFTQIQ